MASLHYLTVQDILWINLQVTKKVQHFNYAKLEEAVFYQYAYGDSSSLLPQAERFLSGFMKLHPFESGNEGTAFLGYLAFLKMNGRKSSLPYESAATWLSSARRGSSMEDLAASVEEDPHHHGSHAPNVRAVVGELLLEYAKAFEMAETHLANPETVSVTGPARP